MTAKADAPHDDPESSGISSFMDSPLERAYGTFEVSLIDVESDAEHQPLKATKTTDFDAESDDERDNRTAAQGHACSGDCCALVSFLWLPFRLSTYAIVLFHIVNALFAIGAAVWITLFYAFKFAVTSVAQWTPSLRRVEAASLRVLLHADAALFNSVCPRSERIMVYSSSTSGGSSVYGFYAQLYFGVGKLVCSALPGVVAAVAYLWAIRNFVLLLVSSPTESAPIEKDVLILLALVAVYAAAALSKVFAAISRYITIFFCAEYLLYSTM